MSDRAEKDIMVTAKLYEARRFMREQLGERYDTEVGEARAILRKQMERSGTGLVEAGATLAKLCADHPGAQGLVFAAIVEEAEAS